MSGQAFEFTPNGPQVLAPTAANAPGVTNAAEAVARIREQVDAKEQARGAVVAPKALRGRSLVAQIRDRLKAVRAELKALRRLEREEAELKRLLAAAKQPPAAVTHITSARKSG